MKISSNGYVVSETPPKGVCPYIEIRTWGKDPSPEDIQKEILRVSDTLAPVEVDHSETPGAFPGGWYVPSRKKFGYEYPQYYAPSEKATLYVALPHLREREGGHPLVP